MAVLEEHDERETRCPQLGGPVTFNYCRRMNRGLPCRMIIGCWHGRLDIVAFLAQHFTNEQLRQAFAAPQGSRLERLVALVARARAARDDEAACR